MYDQVMVVVTVECSGVRSNVMIIQNMADYILCYDAFKRIQS
jgi:hypothetical protein